jgi:type IV secretion system protein VirB10
VIAFSSGGASKSKPTSTAPAATDPSQQRIQEFKQRIEDEAQKLKAEQEQLAEAKRGLASAVTGEGSAPPEQARPAQAQTPHDQIEAERAKREYTSLFASNIALSYRKADQSNQAAPAPAAPSSALAEALQAYTAAAQVAAPHPAPTAEKPPQTEAQSNHCRVPEELRQATGSQYRLFEGTLIETVLTNRLASYFSGPVNCMVTTDVYSHDRQHLLIPQGSRVLGEVRKVDNLGQERLAVFFHRIIMPDGYSVSLDQFKGLNQIGETGLRDQVNHHYLQTFGVALAIGAVAGFSSASANYGYNQTGLDAYRQGTANSLSQSAMQILDKYLNVLPTFTIREGHRVKIFLAGDLLVPAYDNHRMPSDL